MCIVLFWCFIQDWIINLSNNRLKDVDGLTSNFGARGIFEHVELDPETVRILKTKSWFYIKTHRQMANVRIPTQDMNFRGKWYEIFEFLQVMWTLGSKVDWTSKKAFHWQPMILQWPLVVNSPHNMNFHPKLVGNLIIIKMTPIDKWQNEH